MLRKKKKKDDEESQEEDEAVTRAKNEKVKLAKYNLSFLDESIEVPEGYEAGVPMEAEDDSDKRENTHPLGIDPAYRASQDSDLAMPSVGLAESNSATNAGGTSNSAD